MVASECRCSLLVGSTGISNTFTHLRNPVSIGTGADDAACLELRSPLMMHRPGDDEMGKRCRWYKFSIMQPSTLEVIHGCSH